MGTRDPRVDAYIARSAEFARPILTHLRAVIHEACPQVEETLKWGMPSFLYHGILCGMAAFKHHATFGFWRGSSIVDAKDRGADEAMGQFGRMTSLRDLPSRRVLVRYLRIAMKRNEQGVKVPRRRTAPRPALPVPADLRAALGRSRRARATFEAFSPSHRREYIEWIVGAKRPETRARRLATAIGWLAEGKTHNWRYERRSAKRA